MLSKLEAGNKNIWKIIEGIRGKYEKLLENGKTLFAELKKANAIANAFETITLFNRKF